jgi:hypothetical protein
MEKRHNKLRIAAIGLLCLLNIGFGLYSGQLPMLLSGAAGMVYTGTAAQRLCQTQWSVDAGMPAEAARS